MQTNRLHISINGKSQAFSAPLTITALLETLGYKGAYVAVAVNQSCVPRSQFTETRLNDHDTVDILAPFQGG